MDLDRAVDDLAGHARRDDLDHADQVLGALVAVRVQRRGGLQGEQARLFDFAAAQRDRFLGHAVATQRFAEGFAVARAFDHGFQRALGQADKAHAVVDAARAKTRLRDFKAAAGRAQAVGHRHAHVVEGQFDVAVRRVVVAEHRQRPDDAHARRVHRHQHHRLALVRRGVGLGDAHDDEDGAARVGGAGGPPLAAVDDVMLAVAHDRQRDVGGVGAGHVGFGHGEGRADFAGQQPRQPGFLLFGRGEVHQHFHVAGVGRAAVEDLGRVQGTAGELGDGGVVEVAQAAVHGCTSVTGGRMPGVTAAAFGVGQEQVPQAQRARVCLERLELWRDRPARGRVGGVRGETRFGRHDALGDKSRDIGLQLQRTIGKREQRRRLLHAGLSSRSTVRAGRAGAAGRSSCPGAGAGRADGIRSPRCCAATGSVRRRVRPARPAPSAPGAKSPRPS